MYTDKYKNSRLKARAFCTYSRIQKVSSFLRREQERKAQGLIMLVCYSFFRLFYCFMNLSVCIFVSSICFGPFVITAQIQVSEIERIQWETQVGMIAPNEVAIA